MQGKALEQTKSFVYLGGTISSSDMSGQDVRRRIGIACGAMQKLTKIWQSKEIAIKTKVHVYEALVLSIVQYNSETWTLKEKHFRRLRVFEMACLRRIAGISRITSEMSSSNRVFALQRISSSKFKESDKNTSVT